MLQQDSCITSRNPLKREGWEQVYHRLALDKSLRRAVSRIYILLLRYATQKGNRWPVRNRLAQAPRQSTPTSEVHLAELGEHALTARQQGSSYEPVTTCEVQGDRKSEGASAVYTGAFEVRVLRARATLHAATIAAKEPYVKRAPHSVLVTAPVYSSLPHEEAIVLRRSSHCNRTTSCRAMHGRGGRP